MKRTLLATLMVALIATTSACSGTPDGQQNDRMLTDGLIEMTLSEAKGDKDATAAQFCEEVVTQYSKYGSVVTERARIQNNGGHSEEDVVKNLNAQQEVVQAMENHTAQYKVTDNEDVQKANETFREPSVKLVNEFNAAKESRNLDNLDPAIIEWGSAAQSLTMTCLNIPETE